MALAYLDKKTYTITLNSEDRLNLSTTNRNHCSFNIDWSQILPREYNDYKVNFSFGTAGGQYKDTASLVFSSAKVYVDFGSKHYNFDSTSKAQGTMIGLINRDIQTTTSNSNTISCWYQYNPPRTIKSPQANNISVKILNQDTNLLFTDTDSAGTPVSDMTEWTMILELIPIEEPHKSHPNLL